MNKTKSKNVFNIITTVILALAHIVVALAVFLSYQYYSLYPALFISAVAIVVCLLVIIDIVYFVGFNHQDMALKIVTCVLASFIFLGGSIGTYVIAKVNGVVGNILGSGSEETYETYSGVFLSYAKKRGCKQLSDLSGRNVGMLKETTPGLSYIGKSILDEQGFDYAIVDTYTSNTELVQALINGDVDAIVITSAYKSIYENDENSNIKDYLGDFIEMYSFEQDLKIVDKKTKKDLTKEPFNVLLIGWSRTELGSTVGLADAIIVATINPQTYTVSMMSIARDSFVPIACYGGAYDKINSGRSTSRQCFIETVENFIGMEIDYYMEADYLAIVYMVNTLDGVEINNPVDFELDGVHVPAGQYVADGWQALEFCRERHHMPNGDFDRQQHQKEVILAIAKKLVESGDVNLGIQALNNASPYMDTDLTLQELSSVFNVLINSKNYTGLNTFDLVDFNTLRITGNGGLMYYSYSMHLPLWVYLIYQGSYDESMKHVHEVMGHYGKIEQDSNFEFSAKTPYERPPFYSLSYDPVYLYTPDPMPAYWPTLRGMSLPEALAWASDNGVTLNIGEVIVEGDPRYDANANGCVYSQDVDYGSLVSEHKSGTIAVMGSADIDDSKFVPNFVGKNYSKVVKWAKKVDVKVKVKYDFTEDDIYSGGQVMSQSVKVGTKVEDVGTIEVVVRGTKFKVRFDKNNKNASDDNVPESLTLKSDDDPIDLTQGEYVMKDIHTSFMEGGQSYEFVGWFTDKEAGEQVKDTSGLYEDITLYAHWQNVSCDHVWVDSEIIEEATCDHEGSKIVVCEKCGKQETQTYSKSTWECLFPTQDDPEPTSGEDNPGPTPEAPEENNPEANQE